MSLKILLFLNLCKAECVRSLNYLLEQWEDDNEFNEYPDCLNRLQNSNLSCNLYQYFN